MPDFPDSSDWRKALADWERFQPKEAPGEERPAPAAAGRVPLGWWEAAFQKKPTPSEERGHRCGDHQMLTVVAYDITNPKRLVKVAHLCEDYGLRIQYSVFECRLEADGFDRFWADLKELIDPGTDRIVAYKVCANCAAQIRGAGTQAHQEKVVAYVF